MVAHRGKPLDHLVARRAAGAERVVDRLAVDV
jgi:hypothetical protein